MEALLAVGGIASCAALLIFILESQRWRLDAVSARQFSSALAIVAREHEIAGWRKQGARGAAATTRDLSIQVELAVAAVERADGVVANGVIDTLLTEVGPARVDYREILDVRVASERVPLGVRVSAARGVAERVLTGDPVFDGAAFAQGPATVVRGLLTESVRGKLQRLVEGGGSLESGTLIWRQPVVLIETEVRVAIRTLLDLAHDLSTTEGGSVWDRLAHNATHDRVAGVRLMNLTLLQERFPTLERTRSASDAGLRDADAWVRIAAARFMGEQAAEIVEQLASDPATEPRAATAAVALLAAWRPDERTAPLLMTLLKTRTGVVQWQAIETLGRIAHAPALGPLIVVLEHAAPPAAAAAATALGALALPRGESALLGAVDRSERSVRDAAIQALAHSGSVHAVAPLLGQLETGALDAEAAAALRQAVHTIQARLSGAAAGQVSLVAAESEAGRLSLPWSAVEAGRLSPGEEP